MQFLYISTLKIKSILPKKKHEAQLFPPIFGIFFPFSEFFPLFFPPSSERQIEFWRIIKDYVQYFPSLFKKNRKVARIFSAFWETQL